MYLLLQLGATNATKNYSNDSDLNEVLTNNLYFIFSSFLMFCCYIDKNITPKPIASLALCATFQLPFLLLFLLSFFSLYTPSLIFWNLYERTSPNEKWHTPPSSHTSLTYSASCPLLLLIFKAQYCKTRYGKASTHLEQTTNGEDQWVNTDTLKMTGHSFLSAWCISVQVLIAIQK